MEIRERESQMHDQAPSAPARGVGEDVQGLSSSLDQLLQRALHQGMELALAQHRAGQLRTARDMYLAILDTAPEHPDANHNLAVLALEAGDASASLPYFHRACAVQPGNWQYWLSCFDALLQAGEHSTATSMLERKRRSGLTLV